MREANVEKLKIAMLGHKRIPSREGGVEVVVEELAARMAAMGCEITCYNRKGHHVSGEEFDAQKMKTFKGVRIKNVLTINRKGLAALSASFFASVRCAFGKYDVIHYHAEGPCAMLWIPKLFGKKCVATIHGIDWKREKWHGGFASKYILFGEKCAVKYADEIIVLSKNVQEYFLRAYGRYTVCIPNGVNLPEPVPAKLITDEYGLHRSEYFLFLGRLVPEKGLRYLIEAFKQVNTGKKLVIAGGASDSEKFVCELKKMTEEDPRIIFTGFVQGKLLEELYSNAYTYILPSDLEGMPLSLLEAMSYGNCCLTSDIPECAEVVENKAVLFKKGNVSDLKEKIQMLCNDEEMVQSYKNGASDFICRKYNWDDIVTRTLNLYSAKLTFRNSQERQKKPEWNIQDID